MSEPSDQGGVRAFRNPGRVVAALLCVVAVLGSLGVSIPSAGAAGATAEIEFTGRGWGHGRGLGQWGAYGYAQQGWTSAQILDHFYGGTTSQPAPPGGPVNPADVRIELRNQRNQPLTMVLPAGNFTVFTGAGALVLIQPGPGLRISSDGAGGFQWQSGPGCGGPWSDPVALPAAPMFRVLDDNPADDAGGLLRVCDATGANSYSGELRILDFRASGASFDGIGAVNVTTIEEYLRGVVPFEVPASWPDAALQAQAVAARSYALAGDSRQQPYADTCDSTLCQVYGGRYRDGQPRAMSNRTDAAVAATAGVVRVLPSGAIARTEFSSSTGGHTVGGAFAAVVDTGDAVAANPNHTWSVRVSTAAAEAKYGLGRLLSVVVMERNGLDPWGDGGRVVRAELRFQNGTRSLTGNEVRTLFGLKSDWFTPGLVYRTDLEGTPTANYVDGAYRTYVGRAPSAPELSWWYDRLQSGTSRATLTTALAETPEFAGVMIDELYTTSLGRSPDPDGSAYWLDVVVGKGKPYASLGIYFYSSAEYYQRNGATSAGFVTALYRDLLGRAPEPDGLAYWVQQLDVRRAHLDDISAGFYASLESRRDRVGRLYERILGRAADPGGQDASAARLATADDLVLAAELGASEEFYQRSQG